MAGIAGILARADESGPVRAMCDALRHRGPDTVEMVNLDGFSGAVVASALSAARGDGCAAGDGVAVLFDGEIHNERPEGESDADVVLRLFMEHGRTFAAHLEGVFACAVIMADEVVLARDAVGVRPLYRGVTGRGDLCFASEMKALVGIGREVTELLPGTTFSSASGVAGYIPQSPAVDMPSRPEEAALALRQCVMRAVERRLADGAVGACLLSGGLDSSIIAAASTALGAELPAVTVGFEEGAPDVDNARLVAEALGMPHHVAFFTRQEIEALVPRAVRTMESFDEDCVSGTISNLFASGLASTMTNCILSGEGGDELFGGYHLLKDVPTESERLLMMKRLIDVAYNTAVQRLDRAMMGNSITYRTPFIDTEVMAFAAHIPVDWKVHAVEHGEPVEKWLLREAFRDLLPEAIYRRRKLRFSGGTGTDDVMDEIAGDHVDASDLTDETRHTPAGYTLNSPKELWYYRLFKDAFPDVCFERLVGRWDPGK
jgi:asparagine synthase (glutamine-hydrolysing)